MKQLISTAPVVLSAVACGWIGAVLVGGPISPSSSSATALITGAVLAATAVLAAWRVPPAARRRLAAAYLPAVMPLAGVVVAMYVSEDTAHPVVRASALGWVLAAGLPLVAAVAAYRAGGSSVGVDLAFGGAAGVGGAALWQVATVDLSAQGARLAMTSWPINPWWVVSGWVLGAAVVGAGARLPPQPAMRLQLGVAWRVLPFAAAWLMGGDHRRSSRAPP